jgi:hypothetical protein
MLRQSVQTVNLLKGVGDVYTRHDRRYEECEGRRGYEE